VIQNLQRLLQNWKGIMEVIDFPIMLVSLYQTTRPHNPKQNILRWPQSYQPHAYHISISQVSHVNSIFKSADAQMVHLYCKFATDNNGTEQELPLRHVYICYCIETLLLVLAYWSSRSFTWLHCKAYWRINVMLKPTFSFNIARFDEYSDVATNTN
jgi:hypothetical protein